MVRILFAGLMLSFVILVAAPREATAEPIQRRGCCSHHGGVCGCSNGSAKCCDGGLSPTCGCD